MPAADAPRKVRDRLRGDVAACARTLRLGAVELQRLLAECVLAALTDVADDPCHRRGHPSIRSSGTSRIDVAPAASSCGRSRHTSSAGTTLCTACIPCSASGMTLGEPEPGTSAQICASDSSGAFSIR